MDARVQRETESRRWFIYKYKYPTKAGTNIYYSCDASSRDASSAASDAAAAFCVRYAHHESTAV